MNGNEIIKLIKNCNDHIIECYSPLVKINPNILFQKLDILIEFVKEKYKLYAEELKIIKEVLERGCKLNNDISHSLGYLSAILSIMEKEVLDFTEFVNSDRILELQNVKSNYDLTKLIQFCKELNNAYRKKSYLSIPLLIRAIIDHIPPIFGKLNFSDVCGSHGTKSFKDSMNNLDNSLRKIADSTIHTQIRRKETLPNETQINFKADLDVLLSEICRYLGEQKCS